jgi:hypothetical protein
MKLKLPLKRIYNKARIGWVYPTGHRNLLHYNCDGDGSDDDGKPIPVYDLDMVEKIYFKELKRLHPKAHRDALVQILGEELDMELQALRAIYVQKD